jgi:hypothetical protein
MEIRLGQFMLDVADEEFPAHETPGHGKFGEAW